MAVRLRVEVLDNCVGCGICWTVCPKGVLTGTLRGRAVVLNDELCSGCFSCQENCPYNAIRVVVKQQP
ncbi:ATP-binding protein [Vulcanisaeta thermophila]|uniref:ATP-binding protein n=1 Tax=Vulcanisaeta thermophila TaxID=867917 RepID=UPI000852ECA1|nr:4Fe-4S binding protein [Vulcanisaeta thermophila]